MKAAGANLPAQSVPRLFPREHGAYAVLLASWLVGLVVSDSIRATEIVLSIVAFLALFVAQEPLKHIIRGLKKSHPLAEHDVSRLFSLLLFGVSGFALLSRSHGALLWILVPGTVTALLGLWLYYRRASMYLQSLAGFAALTLAGPALVLMSDGSADSHQISRAVELWLELTLFFWASAMIVNVRIDPSSARTTAILLGMFLLCSLIGLNLGFLSIASFVALVVVILRYMLARSYIERYKKLSLKRIGMIETIAALKMVGLYFWL